MQLIDLRPKRVGADLRGVCQLGSNVNHLIGWVTSNMVFEGHSFMSPDFILRIKGKLRISTSYDAHVSGSVIADCVSRAAVVDSKLIQETATEKNILTLYIGCNDISETSGDGLRAYNALKPYVIARVAAGWKVFLWTCTPSTYGIKKEIFEAERNIFNNLLRSDLAHVPKVYILDTDTITEMNDPANVIYYKDLLHPSIVGNELLTDLFQAKAAQLSQSSIHVLSLESISNQSFVSATKWNVDAQWIIAGNKAEYQDTANGNLRQSQANMAVGLKASTLYRVAFTIADTAGLARLIFNNYSLDVSFTPTISYSSRTWVLYIATPANIYDGGIAVRAYSAESTGKFTISNISLREVI